MKVGDQVEVKTPQGWLSGKITKIIPAGLNIPACDEELYEIKGNEFVTICPKRLIKTN